MNLRVVLETHRCVAEVNGDAGMSRVTHATASRGLRSRRNRRFQRDPGWHPTCSIERCPVAARQSGPPPRHSARATASPTPPAKRLQGASSDLPVLPYGVSFASNARDAEEYFAVD